MADGNGLMREFFETKERGTAWAFRIVMAVASSAAAAFTYLAWATFNDLKAEVREQNKLHWSELESIKGAQSTMQTAIEIERRENGDLRTTVRDHETRIRSLERPGLSWPH